MNKEYDRHEIRSRRIARAIVAVSTWFEVWKRRKACPELVIVFMGHVTGSHVISTQTIRRSPQNARGYRHNIIVYLTMNTAIVVRPERIARS